MLRLLLLASLLPASLSTACFSNPSPTISLHLSKFGNYSAVVVGAVHSSKVDHLKRARERRRGRIRVVNNKTGKKKTLHGG